MNRELRCELIITELDAQRLLTITVSTGRAGIDDSNGEYIERHDRLRRVMQKGGP
jgi:hypothetical protein